MEADPSGSGRRDRRDGDHDVQRRGWRRVHRRGGRRGVHQRKRGGRGGTDGDRGVQRWGRRRPPAGQTPRRSPAKGRRGGGDGDRGVNRRWRLTSHSTGSTSLEGLAVALFSPRRVHCPLRSCKSPTLLLWCRSHIDNQLELGSVMPGAESSPPQLQAAEYHENRAARSSFLSDQRCLNPKAGKLTYLCSFYFLPVLLCWYS
jgi:hypothetical protein